MKALRVIRTLILCLVFLAGCSRPGNTGNVDAAKEEIVIWSYFETEAQTEALDALLAGFNTSQNEYYGRWEYVPMTDFTKRLTMAYTEMALPDVAIIDNPDMPACIKMGMFEDITDFLEDMGVREDYYPMLLDTISHDGKMYGLPFNCNNVALIYNKELFQEYGLDPPGTWEELTETAALLTTDERSGFLMSCIEGEQSAFQTLPWILSAGESITDMGGEGTLEALTLIHTLTEQGSMSRNCINLSQTDVARVFMQGGTAMMENGPWVLPMLQEAGIDYGVSPLPVSWCSGVVVGGENLGVLKGKNIEGAKAFLAYYDRNEVMGRFCKETGVLPTKTEMGAWDDTDTQVFQEQMLHAVVRTAIPSWNTVSKQISEAVYSIVSGELPPEEAVKGIGNAPH